MIDTLTVCLSLLLAEDEYTPTHAVKCYNQILTMISHTLVTTFTQSCSFLYVNHCCFHSSLYGELKGLTIPYKCMTGLQNPDNSLGCICAGLMGD